MWFDQSAQPSVSLWLAASEFVSVTPLWGGRGTGVAAVTVFMAVLAVPVRGFALVVPDGGGLGVAGVAGLTRVVGGVEEEGLHWERQQGPLFEVSHVLLPVDKDEMGRLDNRLSVKPHI